MKKTTAFATALTLVSAFLSPARADTLKLSVQTATAKGSIRAAVFSSAAAFERGEFLTGLAVPASVGMTRMEIKTLEPGTYGIALFQDLNGNEELDRNLFGVPSEPFGFSNNPVIKFSAPAFQAFTFEFDGTPTELNITLNGG